MDFMEWFLSQSPKPSPYYGIYEDFYRQAGSGVTEEDARGYYNMSAYFLSMIPIVGDVGYMADQFRSFNDYLKNNNMTWADVMYPWIEGKKHNTSVTSMYGGLNFYSSNISRLYK